MNELNRLYAALTRAWNAPHHANGKLYLELDGQEIPIRLDDMDVYLPLNEALEGDTTDKVFFHPACESIISKETEIFRIIRKLAGFQLLTHFKKFAPVLFDVASKKAKRNLRNDLLERIEVLKAAKPAQRKEVTMVFEHMTVEMESSDQVDRRFIHFDIKRGGRSQITGAKTYYTCKPTFPFYNELVRRLARTEGEADNRPVKLLGAEFSRGALVIAEELFRFVLPGVEDPLTYEQEQVTAEAARFCVFVNTYCAVVDDMNNLQNTFRAEFDKVGVYEIDTTFTAQLEDIDVLYKQVPPMPYNSQSTGDSEAKVQLQTHQMASTMMNSVSTTSNTSQPATQTTTGVEPAGDASNGFADLVRASLQPGEVWVGVQQDPATGKYVHTIQSPAGTVIVCYSRYGNFISRETMMGMGNNMMGGNMMGTAMGSYNPYNYAMMQAQHQAVANGGMSAQMFAQPTAFGQVTPQYHNPVAESPVLY